MTLTIHNILKRDIGPYMCVATNSMGKTDGTIRLYGKIPAATSAFTRNQLYLLLCLTEIKVAQTKPTVITSEAKITGTVEIALI